MARYDRRLLIPYLRDLYCTELLLLKKKEEQQKTLEKRRKLRDQLQAEEIVDEPAEQSSAGLWILCLLSVLMCTAVILSAIFLDSHVALFGILLLGSVLIGAVCIVFLIRKRKLRKEQLMERRQRSKWEEEQERLCRRIEYCEQYLEELGEMCNILHGIRHSLYSVNIIPVHYRTLYVVQYLFEYFKTSKADDVDLVLQTFAIEEIREPHQGVSRKLADLTLRQRMVLSNQMVGDEEQRRYAEVQLQAVAEMAENVDLQLQYQRIILENWNLSNYLYKYEQNI